MNQHCCDDWKPQIEKINAPIILQEARTGKRFFDGIPFRFCPWCGKPRQFTEKVYKPETCPKCNRETKPQNTELNEVCPECLGYRVIWK